ncbi:MAG: L,D-transpeptidase [Candidatus Metalachnospira sp.]|nr:L,D-transpeptidase [Candidatus Metalachnospira sp.]
MRRIITIVLSVVMIIGCSSAAFAANKDKYILYVNCSQNVVTVYENDGYGEYKPIKAFVCSVGEDTPSGTFKTSDKYTWRLLFGDVYGQYATRITGHILFHSVPYYTENKNDLEYEEYNKLGETASMGCIRLAVKDAKWIYDNCLSGTTVKIYKSNVAEPMAKPAAIKINLSNTEKRGWDPTDPDPSNPWKAETVTEEVTQNSNNANTMETVNIKANGNEISLEAYKAEDGQYFFDLNDVVYAFSSAGKNISFSNSGNIIYIKNTTSLYTQKSAKKQFTSAQKGSIAAVYESKSAQLNTYNIDGNMYFSIAEVTSLVGLTNITYNI